MSIRLIVALACLSAAGLAPVGAHADCLGFLNQSEQGYKLEGIRIEKSGPVVAAGTQLEFNGITTVKDRGFLTRARSDVMFDAQNVELTSGCDLPSRSPPQAR